MAGKQSLTAVRQPSAGFEVHPHSNTPPVVVLHKRVSRSVPSSLIEGFFSGQPVCEQTLTHTHAVTCWRLLILKLSKLDANELVPCNE